MIWSWDDESSIHTYTYAPQRETERNEKIDWAKKVHFGLINFVPMLSWKKNSMPIKSVCRWGERSNRVNKLEEFCRLNKQTKNHSFSFNLFQSIEFKAKAHQKWTTIVLKILSFVYIWFGSANVTIDFNWVEVDRILCVEWIISEQDR